MCISVCTTCIQICGKLNCEFHKLADVHENRMRTPLLSLDILVDTGASQNTIMKFSGKGHQSNIRPVNINTHVVRVCMFVV